MDSYLLSLTLPSELCALLGSHAQASETVKEYVILGLYQDERISAGKAAELLGLNLRSFVSLLARKGIAYFRYDTQEWEREVKAVRQWQAGKFT